MPLSIKNMPKSYALKMFELGYDAAVCQDPEQFRKILKTLPSMIPVKHVLCGFGGIESGWPLNSVWNTPSVPPYKIDQIVEENFPTEYLETYLMKIGISRDNLFYESLRHPNPQLWIDVYSKNRHPFDPRTKKGFDPMFVKLIFDYGLCFNSLCSVVNKDELISSFVLTFNSKKEAYSFAGLYQALVPYLNIALLRTYQKTKESPIFISRREMEVLKWLIEGKTNWEISVILNISERTVKFHIQNLMKKLGATNRYHLVAAAFAKQITNYLKLGLPPDGPDPSPEMPSMVA